MKRFKKGQKVVCISTNWPNIFMPNLKKGSVYTCNGYSTTISDSIRLEGFGQDYTWHEKYFAPLEDDGSRLALTAVIEEEALEELKLEEIEVN